MPEHARAESAEDVPADVQARFDLVASRIDQPLTTEQAAQLRGRIARSIALGVTLREYPLGNGDEPEIALVPYRGVDR